MASKNWWIFSLLLILLSSPVFAEIRVTPIIRETYNLGDAIAASAFVKQTEHLQGLFKLTISCGDYALTYSITPLIMEYGVERNIEAQLTLIGRMTGECEIIAEYESIESSFTEEKRSNRFTVTRDLEIDAVIEESEFLPQQKMIIAGTVKRRSGDYVGNETITLNFQDKDYTTGIKDGRFIYKIEILPSTKSGSQELLFLVEDKNGNKGELNKKITIVAIPSRLGFSVNKKSFVPSEILKLTPLLYDQSDSPIEKEVNLQITDPKRKAIVNKDVLSNNEFTYKFDQQTLPGEYKFKISKDKLSKEGSITVEEVEDLDIKLKENIVYITNTGNTPYKDTLTVILESETNQYVLNKKLSLKPGETIEIDLSRDVKEGIYDIVLSTEKTKEQIIKDAKIEDNRGLIKKVTQGLGISGNVVSLEGKSSSKLSLIWVIVIVVFLAIIVYYRRGLKKQGPKEETVALETPQKENDSELKE